jgi:hypothetical protein
LRVIVAPPMAINGVTTELKTSDALRRSLTNWCRPTHSRINAVAGKYLISL